MSHRNERARSQLLLMLNFLGLWQRQDMAQVIACIEKHESREN